MTLKHETVPTVPTVPTYSLKGIGIDTYIGGYRELIESGEARWGRVGPRKDIGRSHDHRRQFQTICLLTSKGDDNG